MYYVYILYSKKDRNLYVGKTKDLCKRLEKHNKGLVKSTRNRRPLILIQCEVYKLAKEAFVREKELKYPSAGKIKKEIKEKLDL